MADAEVTEIKPPQVLRERVRREHDAALAPRRAYGDLPADFDRTQLTELLKPETLRRNADSLPVLAAFQEFLEIERRRTRGRMLTLTLLFLLVLFAGGGIAGFLGLSYYRQTKQQTQAVKTELADLRNQVTTGTFGLAPFSNLLTRASHLQSAVDEGMSILASEQDGLAMRVEGLNTNVANLHSTIARLQDENDQITRQMEARVSQWQSITGEVDRLMALLAQASPALSPGTPASRIPAPSSWEAPAPVATESRNLSLVLAIIPEGSTRAVDWRIPLQSTRE